MEVVKSEDLAMELSLEVWTFSLISLELECDRLWVIRASRPVQGYPESRGAAKQFQPRA
jgi:hypothetical protein